MLGSLGQRPGVVLHTSVGKVEMPGRRAPNAGRPRLVLAACKSRTESVPLCGRFVASAEEARTDESGKAGEGGPGAAFRDRTHGPKLVGVEHRRDRGVREKNLRRGIRADEATVPEFEGAGGIRSDWCMSVACRDALLFDRAVVGGYDGKAIRRGLGRTPERVVPPVAGSGRLRVARHAARGNFRANQWWQREQNEAQTSETE